MTLDGSYRFAIAQSLLEHRGVDDVGKKERQQLNPMIALKFLDLCKSLERDLLQVPVGHGSESTKPMRGNQRES